MEIYLILFAIPFFIFILGLVLAIINFKAKKLTLEVIAWACILILAIANTILSFNSSSLGIFPMGISESQALSVPIYAVLFLLLQYRCNQAKDIQTFRVFYLLKSFCLVQILSVFMSFGISAAYSGEFFGLDKPQNRQITSYILSGISMLIYSTFFSLVIFRYFKTTTPLPVLKSMLAESFLLVFTISVIAQLWNLASLFIQFSNLEWFSITYILTTASFLIVESVIAAWLGSYIYLNKADKISA
ncbi:hypothetical protein [Pedobacter nototheniae]|uniref:hypothetical protein n=1 Tax=Pedobacter nototheniae TaxID=2488994 RepID=UPI00292EA8CB|nr:hypothetical protein [Pedobacter nototheniae]